MSQKHRNSKLASEQYWLVGVELTSQVRIIDTEVAEAPDAEPVYRRLSVRRNDVTQLSPVEYLVSLLPHFDEVVLVMALRITKAEAERAVAALQRAEKVAGVNGSGDSGEKLNAETVVEHESKTALRLA